MFKLVIQDDEGKTTVVPLIRDEITIGRKEGNTIRLTERNVSRKHARISRANGAVAIEDLGSYNGVRVNGTRISQRTVLSVSDRVQIGDYLIELKAEGVEQPVAYEDARTQPIERVDAAALARTPPQMVPVQPALGLADTDPSARAAPATMPMPAAATPARLVILSSNFAGREFQLTKPQMVIGRTDDNDIVINHRSISRNHAKVVREPDTGRFTIMDLQSSNGVRVNGEDYGKVELRRGDTVDLGHVRLRFVEPGEDFLFGRDAQVVDVPTGGKKGWIYALLGLVVVGGIVAVVMTSGGGSKPEVAAKDEPAPEQPGAQPAASPNPGEPGPAPVAAPDSTEPAPAGPGTAVAAGTDKPAEPPPVKANPPTPAVDASQVSKLMGDARTAMEASKWAEASNVALQVLKLDPGNADARAIADQAKRELNNENAYSKFADAAQRKQYEKAVNLFEKIPSDSVYKNKARDQYDQLHDHFIAEKKAQAQALARQKRCRDLRKLASDAARAFPDAREVIAGVPCEEPQAVAAGGGGGDRSGGPPGGGGGGGGGGGDTSGGNSAPPPSDKSAEELVVEAETAAKASQWARALKLSEDTLRAKPDSSTRMRAVTAAVLAACNLKNAGKAKTYFAQLPNNRQIAVRQRCIQNGVTPE